MQPSSPDDFVRQLMQGNNAVKTSIPNPLYPAQPTSTPPPTTTPTNTGPTVAQQQAAAAAAAKAAQDAKIQQLIDTNRVSTLSDANANIGAANASYTGQADNLGATIGSGQNNINEARRNIGLTQINSIKGLVNTIREGLRGSASTLGNTNALDSSAAGAVARAYSNFGNVETNKVNNAAAEGNQGQDVAQTNLGLQRDAGMSTLKAFRDQSIADITNKATQALSALQNTIAYMGGDSSKVDAEGIKQQILNDAQSKLALVDAHIQSVMGGINPNSADDTARAAYEGSNAGVAPSGPGLPYQIDQPAPGQAPSTTPADTIGAANSLIPLALKPRTV